ncbi:T9SS type B sorting domain-containing protein [Flavobacterium sp.]|uniref:T9SS type B sorting domain-containing protein n=1 Tax=Flavobacterium sp. TaxID=239 RepID=UPI0031D3B151
MNLCKKLLVLFLFCSNLYAQNDCKDALIVCGNSGFKGLTINGPGNINEIKPENSCGTTESNSIWLKILIKTSGTLGFIITPESSDLKEDFDFFVFGPNAKCSSLSSPIRCSTTNPQMAHLTNNQTGIDGNHYDTFEGPAALGDGYLKWLNVNEGESYFVVVDRPIGSSNFSLQWLGNATFYDAPTINISSPNELNMTNSDFSASMSSTFDLTVNSPKIIGSQTDIKVTYHNTSNDAIININPIENPTAYKNTTSQETIFVRATNTTTQCYNVTSFTIKVNDKIDFPKNKVETCDENDVDPYDGKTVVNLNQVSKIVFDNADISSLTIKYYLSQNDADNNINELPNQFSNSIPFEQTIYIKAFNSTISASVAPIKIVVNPLPQKVTTSLVQCDTGENASGLVLFNLNEANASLSNNDSNLETSFFNTNTDALNNQNQLNPVYTNTSNPQTLYVRVRNLKTNCTSISNLILKTNVISVQTHTLNLVCDDDGNEDGIHLFDLTSANITVSNNQDLKYYQTENDALLEQNSIENPLKYENKIPYNDFAFARIEEGNTCFGISKIKLEVAKLPSLETDTSTNVCDNDSSFYAKLDAGVTNDNALNDFSYIWKKGGSEIPDQTNSTLNVNTIGTYTVTVTNKNNCSKTRKLEVVSSNIATIKDIEIIDLQIDDSNKVTVYATGNGDYEYSLNAPSGPFQDSNIFENVKSGIHDVYINDKKKCGIINKTIAVIGVPHYFTPNNDGHNDYWNIAGLNKNEYKDSKVYIYDRYGKLIKQFTVFDIGWDGTFQGSPLPSDDYWYLLKLSDHREAKGHFSLKR